MARRSLAGLDHRRLRLALVLFLLALAVPAGILVHQAYGQLKWEAFHHYRNLAEELTERIDSRVAGLVAEEELRSFADYGFLVVTGDPAANFLQRSVLSAFPVASDMPGLLGYFQVDSQGTLSTPLLPVADGSAASYGISVSELGERRALEDRIRGILSRHQLVQDPEQRNQEAGLEETVPTKAKRSTEETQERRLQSPAAGQGRPNAPDEPTAWKRTVTAQGAFDRLDEGYAMSLQREVAPATLGRVEDLDLNLRYRDAPADVAEKLADRRQQASDREQIVRKERSVLPEPGASPPLAEQEANAPSGAKLKLDIFESELDALELRLLDSGHFVLYRKVWRDGERSIQGALIEQAAFLQGTVEAAFRETVLSRMSDLAVAYGGVVLAAFSAQTGRGYLSSTAKLSGDLLQRSRLSAPAGDLELIFSISRLPAGPGARVIGWTAATLVLVLCGGFFLLDLLGRKQLDLARQRQDFVSAVSHELKTPLTSIRMYAEMLREGWADEERKRTYYAFISEESERLTRLINNVLQLARLTRNDLRVELKPVSVGELMEDVRPKIASLTDRAGFSLELDCGSCAAAVIRVDEDFFTQILINLVDNAVKFSRNAERKQVRIACRTRQEGRVSVSVRDYGPGVPRDQMKKIFRLFYRSGNELTRDTPGTGIGLALVRELASAMGGRVDLVDARPGAELVLMFPMHRDDTVGK